MTTSFLPFKSANRLLLAAGAAVMAIGSAAHLAIIAIGAQGYAMLGAPAGLVAMVGTPSYRPALTCLLIAGFLAMGALYGLSGAELVRRLPARRLVLTVLGIGLVARGLLLPIVVAWQPRTLAGICGRCQAVDGFVLLTSALCLFVGIAYAAGANMRRGASCD